MEAEITEKMVGMKPEDILAQFNWKSKALQLLLHSQQCFVNMCRFATLWR